MRSRGNSSDRHLWLCPSRPLIKLQASWLPPLSSHLSGRQYARSRYWTSTHRKLRTAHWACRDRTSIGGDSRTGSPRRPCACAIERAIQLLSKGETMEDTIQALSPGVPTDIAQIKQ